MCCCGFFSLFFFTFLSVLFTGTFVGQLDLFVDGISFFVLNIVHMYDGAMLKC